MIQSGRKKRSGRPRQRGVAAVEMAILLPLLVLLFVLGVDFARIFYYSVTVTNCARSGAMHAANSEASPFDSVQAAALAEAQSIEPPPTVEVRKGFNSQGQAYTEVTVSYEFRTVTNYLGAASPITIVRKVRAEEFPDEPNY